MNHVLPAPPTRVRAASFDWRVAGWLPVGADGLWEIERFTWSKRHLQCVSLSPLLGNREPLDGEYTRLVTHDSNYSQQTVMSDVPAEIEDHRRAWQRARGRVLVHGLGLGMFVAACLRKPEVGHVTVIEKSPSVVRLVAPHLQRLARWRRLTIVCGDALTWAPARGERWDVAWHDIWTHIDPKNLLEMKRLHRKFAKYVGWQGSWSRNLIEGESS